MRSNGHDGERFTSRFASEEPTVPDGSRSREPEPSAAPSEPAGALAKGAKSRAKKLSKSLAPKSAAQAAQSARPEEQGKAKNTAKRGGKNKGGPKSRRAPASASRAESLPAPSVPAPISMDPRTTLRDHPGQKSAAHAARAATASMAPSRRDDEISIPPTSSDPPSDLDDRFFAEGEAAAHAAHAQALQALTFKHASGRPHSTEHTDDLDAPRPVVVPPERRKKLTNYVKIAVGFSAFLCLAAGIRVGVSHVVRSGGVEQSAAAAQIAVVAPAPNPIQTATAPAPVVPPPAAVEVPPAVPAEPVAPAKSAKEEKESARASLEHGKRQDAIDAAGRSVDLDPTDAEAWLILGAAQQEANHWKEARASFSECTKQAKVGPISECGMMLR